MEEPMDDRPWTDANEMEELPALDFSPPPAEQRIGEEHEALAQRLLGYLAFCARTTYRALGIRNVFDAGKPVIGLPRDAWDSLSAEGLRIQGKDADGTYTDDDVRKHLILRRAGWDIVHIPYHEWQQDAEGCLARILARLSQPVLPASQSPTTDRIAERPVAPRG